MVMDTWPTKGTSHFYAHYTYLAGVSMALNTVLSTAVTLEGSMEQVRSKKWPKRLLNEDWGEGARRGGEKNYYNLSWLVPRLKKIIGYEFKLEWDLDFGEKKFVFQKIRYFDHFYLRVSWTKRLHIPELWASSDISKLSSFGLLLWILPLPLPPPYPTFSLLLLLLSLTAAGVLSQPGRHHPRNQVGPNGQTKISC